MNNLSFGVHLPENVDYEEVRKFALSAESLGYRSIWYSDHLAFKEAGKFVLESWVTLSSLAAITERVRLGPLLTCNLFRNPSLLAKMAATVDVISEGRLEMGIGAGWNKYECDTYGIRFPRQKERTGRLLEALEVLKRMWTEKRANYKGRYYTIKEVECWPRPLQKPYPPITIGGWGEKTTPEMAARYAQRYNPNPWTCTLEKAEQYLAILQEKCSEVGRSFKEIEKVWFGWVAIPNETKEFEESRAQIETRDIVDTSIIGTPQECTRIIRDFARTGMNYFIAYFGTDASSMKTFAEKVIPRLRKTG